MVDIGGLEYTRRGALSDVTLISKGPESVTVNIIFHFSYALAVILTFVKYYILPWHNHIMIDLSEQVSRGAIVVKMESPPAHVQRKVDNLSKVTV